MTWIKRTALLACDFAHAARCMALAGIKQL
jgi:hypothetical protein